MKIFPTPIKPLLSILNRVFPYAEVASEDEKTQEKALERLDRYLTALPGYDPELTGAIWELSERCRAVVALESRDVLVIFGPEGWRHKLLSDDEFRQLWESDVKTPVDGWFDAP